MARQTQNIRVAIDARMLGREATGVATYARALEAALDLLGEGPTRISDPSCDKPMGRAALPARWLRWADALLARRRKLRETSAGFWGRDVFRLAQVHFDRHGSPLCLRAPGAPGIVHWTYPLPIRIEGWTNIYTVHDAIPLTHPHLSEIEPGRHRRLLTALVASAEHLLTVSEAARQDIIAALDCPPALISSCPPGLPVEQTAATPRHGLDRDNYMVFVGSVEPRKNLVRLAEAYRTSGTSMPLVLAGPDGWRSEEIVPALDATPGIIRLPYVDRATLAGLIAGARALLFPSIIEGFGLPIVEAMQLGTAVLTSRGSATGEVGGDAALLVDPFDVKDIAAAIARLASDAALARQFAAKGDARAADYTPAAFAGRLDAIHRKL